MTQPLFWFRPRSDGGYDGPIHDSRMEAVRKRSGGWVPLYPSNMDSARLAAAEAFIEKAFQAHPNLDLDIEAVNNAG